MERDKALIIVRDLLNEYDDKIVLTSANLNYTLDSVGIDSLDLVELGILIEDKIGLEISPSQLNTITTINDLVRTLEVFG